MPYPPLFTTVGISREPAYGAGAVAGSFVALNGEPKPKPELKMLEDKSWRGWMGEDQDFIPGNYWTSFNWDGNAYPDIVGFPVIGVLGDVLYSGTQTAPSGLLSTAINAVGAVQLNASVAIPAGTLVQIDAGPLAEVRTIGTQTGTGPYVTPLAAGQPPLAFLHAANAPVTAIASPYTVVSAVLNTGTGQPPSFAITDNYGPNARQYPGAVFTEFGLKFSADALLTYSAKCLALPEVVVPKPQASYSAERAIAGYTGLVTLGGTATQLVESGELTIKREAEPILAVDGVQAPRQIWGSMVSADGKLTITMEDDTHYLNFINNTQPSLDLNYAFGSGVNARQIRFHLSKAAYTAATIARGKKWVQVEVTFKGRFNTTDAGPSGGASPIAVTLTNSVLPGTYK